MIFHPLVALQSAVAAVCPIDGIALLDPVAHTVRIDFSTSATPAQQTAANGVVAAFDWTAATQATREAQTAKTAAAAGIDAGALKAGDKHERLFVAVVGMILDEFNLHKDKHNALLNAIDASTTYATLKTNIAAIPDYPTRTHAQLVTALKAKIAATAE